MALGSPPQTVAYHFGAELRRLRRAAGLSQEKVASRAGLHRTYISQLERGVKTPTLDTLFRIAGALDESPIAIVKRVHVRLARAAGK